MGETDLSRPRVVYYDPKAGRFISEDPIRFGGGDVNLYRYVGNNPILYTDPTGNQRISEVIFFGVILGAVVQQCTKKKEKTLEEIRRERNKSILSDDPNIRRIQEENMRRNREIRERGF